MSEKMLDAVIIGGGTAGLAALREVRKRTDRYLLVNDGPWGTTCARVGCMPSKMLIEAANAFYARRELDTFGIRGGDALRVDLPAVLARVRELRDDFVTGTLEATQDDERVVSGRGRLLDARRVEVNGQVRQQSLLDQMIWSVPEVLHELSKLYALRAGDLIFMGTPAGVGPLLPGDQFSARLENVGERHGIIAG